MKRKILTLVCALLCGFGATAQEENDDFDLSETSSGVSFDGGFDLTSSYVWRGNLLVKGANFQPYLDFYAGNFTLGLWNCTDFNGILKEFDIFASYTVADQLTFTVTDYFTQEDTYSPDAPKYGNFKSDETAHALEFSIDWASNFGLDASFNILFYGADKKYWLEDDDPDEATKNAYGTYFELGYTADVKGVEFRPCVGMVFNPSTWYGDGTGTHDGFNVVNLGVKVLKEIHITDKFKLPVYAAFGYNPQADDVAAFAGFNIGF
ncbi:MAG: hypothetical protein II956_09290 [Bacteroidales bacterium]|nr:hypothetical protein [Bacteroidales bacterium]